MKNNYLVIMAGGVGSRFWPFSRESYPKQFHDVLGVGKTLLQQTVERFTQIFDSDKIFIVTNLGYKKLVIEQLPFLTEEQIIEEPHRNNTAPCIAYAAFKISTINPNAVLCITPSDHLVLKEHEFRDCIQVGLKAAADSEELITLGIEPTRPDSGYGYIQFDETDSSPVKKIVKFHEKPSLIKARQFIDSKNFLWNAGIFIFSVSTIKKSFQKYAPKIYDLFDSLTPFYFTNGEKILIDVIYSESPEISFDYAIMEKAENCSVISANVGWSDLGTWKSLHEASQKDDANNVIDGKVIVYDINNCIIKTPKDLLVVAQGLQDYIIAKYDNVLMICQKEQEQKVKQFVQDAKKEGLEYI